MNNLLPRKVKYHQKFDLKGSTYKRQASAAERQKQVPTLKDLDFMQLYPEGENKRDDSNFNPHVFQNEQLGKQTRPDCSLEWRTLSAENNEKVHHLGETV